MDEIRKAIGENIRKVCALKGVKQVEISRELGISQGSISNWMKGINSIDIENLAKLCSYLGVSLNQIYGIDPIDPESFLTSEEFELIRSFRSLNKSGRKMVIDLTGALAGNAKLSKTVKTVGRTRKIQQTDKSESSS